MEYRELGKSSLHISTVSFGCMSLEADQQKTTLLLQKAVDLGVNYFDTADLYQNGLNEEMVGKALKEKRKDIAIATKVGNQLRADGKGWDWNPRKEYILQAIDKSLQRLQTDYIDLYQLHGGTIEDPIDDIIEAFELLQQQGKIRYYGISSIRPNMIREYVKRSNIVSVMMQYSLLDLRPEEECLPLLLKNNIGVLARGSLAKGLLAGKTAAPFLNYSAGEVQQLASLIDSYTSSERSATQIALSFVGSNPAVSSAVVGIRTEQQLMDIVNSNYPELNMEELTALSNLLEPNRYEEHR